MDPKLLLEWAGANGWSCLAFCVATAAWVFDRWDSRQHQREHREAALELRSAPEALAKLPDGGTVPSGRQAGIPLAVLAVILGAGALATVTYKIAVARTIQAPHTVDARATASMRMIGDFAVDNRPVGLPVDRMVP